MTQDEIIRMAREAGFEESRPMARLKRFASLVAAHVKLKNAAAYYEEGYEAGQHDEREACAKVCEERFEGKQDMFEDLYQGSIVCAAAIRARGENGTA